MTPDPEYLAARVLASLGDLRDLRPRVHRQEALRRITRCLFKELAGSGAAAAGGQPARHFPAQTEQDLEQGYRSKRKKGGIPPNLPGWSSTP